MRSWVLSFLVACGAVLAHVSHRSVDVHRRGQEQAQEFVELVPSGEALSWVSLGFQTQLADWIWIRAVLKFGDDAGPEQTPEQVAWFESALRASIELDPEWRSLYSYGSLMMKVLEDYSTSTHILELAVEQFPEDEYFPFSLGANHYLQGKDSGNPRLKIAFGVALAPFNHPGLRMTAPAMRSSLTPRHSVLLAHMWMLHASQKEEAPDWYASAAHAFIARKNEREVAVRFLSDQLKAETDPMLIDRLTVQLNSEMHALHSERLTALLRSSEEDGNTPIRSLTELVERGALTRLPSDPYESEWVIDVDGVVRSQRMVEVLERRARNSERTMLAFGL